MMDVLEQGFKGVADVIKEAFGKAFGIIFDDIDEGSRETVRRFRKDWKEALGDVGEGIGEIPAGGGGGGSGRGAPIQAQGGYEGYVSQAAQPFIAHRGEYVSVTPAREVEGRGNGGIAEVRMSIENTFHIQTLDPSTMRDIVRNQIEPQILDSIETNVKKIRWQEALGVT